MNVNVKMDIKGNTVKVSIDYILHFLLLESHNNLPYDLYIVAFKPNIFIHCDDFLYYNIEFLFIHTSFNIGFQSF